MLTRITVKFISNLAPIRNILMPSLLSLFLFLCLLLMAYSRPLPIENHKLISVTPTSNNQTSWQISFQKLLDSEPGSDVSGLSKLKQYLHRFGYLNKPVDANFTDAFDDELKSAVSLYQSNLGLVITGRLDAQTITQLSSPRCGFPDPVGVVARYAYFSGQPRWARPSPITLTYAVSPNAVPDYIPRRDLEAAVRRAFARWARVIPVRFSPAEDYAAADVRLGFYGGDHGDGEPFDGVLGVLAHAFSPESGRLHMDAAERWAVDFDSEGSKVAIDLESVATHEIGHVLGLGHSRVREAVMYPSLSPRTKKVDLTVDDVEGVQVLYGSNPSFNISSLPESETSSADAAASIGGLWVGINVAMIVLLI